MSLYRTIFRTTIGTTAAATTFYLGQHYYNTTEVHFLPRIQAESLPSDSRAALTKVKWSGFTELKLKSSEQVNHNVKKLTFALPTDDSISGLEPVTSLLSQHTAEGSWIPTFRPYTPVSANDVPGEVTFMVKRYPNGKGSGKMHSLKPGESMKFKPLHEFDYKPNAHQELLLIGGGSGITPFYQLINAVLRNPQDKTKISLVYANNSAEDILLRSEFENLEKEFPGRFRKVFAVSKGDEQGMMKGYVSKEMISKVWDAQKKTGQKVLVSGPPGMTDAVAGAKGFFGWTQGSLGGILRELGYTKEDVHKF